MSWRLLGVWVHWIYDIDVLMESHCAGAMLFVRRQMSLGSNPRAVLRTLLPHETDSDIPDDLDDMTLWRLIISLVSGPPRRHRLTSVSTLDDVVRLLHSCTKIIVLTGAGVRNFFIYMCMCVGTISIPLSLQPLQVNITELNY